MEKEYSAGFYIGVCTVVGVVILATATTIGVVHAIKNKKQEK